MNYRAQVQLDLHVLVTTQNHYLKQKNKNLTRSDTSIMKKIGTKFY